MKLDGPQKLWLLAGLFIFAIFLTISFSIIDPPSLQTAPAGQLLYRLSKCFGLLAGLLVCLQVIIGCLNAYLGGAIWPWGLKGHVGVFGALAFAVVLHIVFFMSAGYLRTDHFPLQLLIPNLFQDYYFRSVAIGALALYVLLMTAYFGYRRVNSGVKFKLAHRLSYLFFGLAIFHSLSIGTESRSLLFIAVLISTTAMIVLMVWKTRVRKTTT